MAAGLSACGLLSVIQPATGEGPKIVATPAEPAQHGYQPVRSTVIDSMPPAAPGGAGPRRTSRPSTRLSVEAPADRGAATLLGDRIALEILGSELGEASGFEYRHASRRNVIEHVIQGNFGVGVVVSEPSVQERKLGARDFILGEFQLALCVHPQNPTRCLPIRDAQALLSGRRQAWPSSGEPVRIFGPAEKSRAAVFAELLVPGDPLAIASKFDEPTEILTAVLDDRHAIGIVPRATMVAHPDHGLSEFVIPGFRPTKTLRIVFRDSNDPDCAALLDFCRSGAGHVLLSQRIVLR